MNIIVCHNRYCNAPYGEEYNELMHYDGIWLHALRYEGSDWSFESPLPDWASPFSWNNNQ